ncbi:MAG: threonine synthase [Nannocystaceae bacterium]|nr:threonine synthase [Nannocystaceae bacterium]
MPDTYLIDLVCSSTGAAVPWERLQGLSAAGRPLVCRYDLPRVAASVDRDAIAARPRGMWRWRELLPLPGGHAPVSLGEGDTPLLATPRLARELGVRRLWLKDEAGEPTGSFKARGISAAVTMALHLGARAFAVPSAGNAGGALAAYAARAGVPAHVFVPRDTPEVNQREVLLFGAQLHRIDGLIHDCGRVVAEQREALGAFDLSTLKEPYRLEGKKTMGLELLEQLGWRVPDVVVYPTGGGTGLIGVHAAIAAAAALGWLDEARQPRFVAVQASGCAPIVRAFERGQDEAALFEGAHTCASGLRVPKAVGDRMMLQILRSTGGTAIAIDDDTLMDATRELARSEGINACPEAGACIAAIRRLRASGWLRADDEVVTFNTGAGTKYVEQLPPLS